MKKKCPRCNGMGKISDGYASYMCSSCDNGYIDEKDVEDEFEKRQVDELVGSIVDKEDIVDDIVVAVDEKPKKRRGRPPKKI